MKRLAILLAVVACGDERNEPRSSVPGTIYAVEDGDQLVRSHGGVRTQLARGVFPSTHALPDGRLVAIASRGDGSAESEQLALVERDGRTTRIGPTAAQLRDPAVDPRGRWVVVAANLDGHSDLYRIGLDGRTERLTNDPEGNYAPAVIGDAVVYVSSRDGNAELYRGSQRLTAFQRDDWQPTPSPDGNTLAFLSDREGPVRIFLMAPDGTSLRRLTTRTDAVDETDCVWSRDGKQLAYAAGDRVIVRELASATERTLGPGLEPAFSPDGNWLAVARTRGTSSDVVAIELASLDVEVIAEDARLPRWLP